MIDPQGLRRFRFRFGVVTGTSIVAAIVALVGVFANAITIATDATSPTFETGDWLVGDLGSNLQVAGLIGVGALLVGAVVAGFGIRWGAGLAGGAGLAIAGWAALVIGLAEQPLQAATIAVKAADHRGVHDHAHPRPRVLAAARRDRASAGRCSSSRWCTPATTAGRV